MGRYDKLVYGERIDDLFPALKAFADAGSVDEDGMFVSEVKLEPAIAQPLFRALMRVEAERLLEDAEAPGSGPHEERSAEERAAEAFLRVVDAWGARTSDTDRMDPLSGDRAVRP